MVASNSRQIGKMTLTVPSDREIVLTRTFDAPRRLVWEALTRPEHVPQWWGPRGTTMLVDKMDLRPGGAWRFVSRGPDGSEHGFRGEYREIVPLERIVQTFEWEGLPGHISTNTLVLEERGGRTFMTSTSAFESREDRDGMIATGMESGAREGYDRLDAVLKTL